MPSRTAEVLQIITDVEQEVHRAMQGHPPYNSAHEAYAVLLEEVDEFWDEVRKRRHARDLAAMRKELIQVAAVAIKAIHDLNI